MSKTRYCYSTKLADFCKDPNYVALLYQRGIFTLGGFLQTPVITFLSDEELRNDYDKYVELFFRIYKLVCFHNFTL